MQRGNARKGKKQSKYCYIVYSLKTGRQDKSKMFQSVMETNESGLFRLPPLVVPSSAAMVYWHPNGEFAPPAVFLHVPNLYLHYSSG